MLNEFKKFAVKGNVVDMAVGIMIGGAFSTVVKSVVDDILMPPLGLATGGLDFKDQFVVISPGKTAPPYATLDAAREAGATVISYGQFLNNIVSFLLIAVALFLIIRWINKLRGPEPDVKAPTTRPCPYCVTQIDIAATRCAHCTSEVPPNEADEAA